VRSPSPRDDERVRAAFFAVVAHETRPQPPRLDPDDRVGARVEGGILVEDLDADHVLLELIAASRERFGHREVEEALEPVDLPEGDARQHPLELRLGGLVAVLLGGRCGGADRHHFHFRAARCAGFHGAKRGQSVLTSSRWMSPRTTL
jgi:hypothetical protein